MAKLGQQIAKLMAALTETRQSSGPTSAPGSPWECGCGCGQSRRGTPVTQTPTMVEVHWPDDPGLLPTNRAWGRRCKEPGQWSG